MSYKIEIVVGTNDAAKTVFDYYKEIGWVTPETKDEELENYVQGHFVVEVKNYPKVFEELLVKKYSVSDKQWQLHCINEKGLVFYIANTNFNAKDVKRIEAYIHIPRENIICIHSVTEAYLNDL